MKSLLNRIRQFLTGMYGEPPPRARKRVCPHVMHFQGHRYLSPMLHLCRPMSDIMYGLNMDTCEVDMYESYGEGWMRAKPIEREFDDAIPIEW